MNYKKTFRYSTGNPIVDEVGTMNFTGNVIPMIWFKTIRYPNGAPNNNAIHILADIVYWYRPKEERDEESGQLVGIKKKFRDDYLQRSYDQMADTFGLSKKQATEAVKILEKMGIIKRIFKTIQVRGQVLNNVLFIELIPKRLYEVTFPEDIEENTLSPPEEIPLSVEGGRGILEKREDTTSKVTDLALKGETNTKNTIENTNRDYLSINQSGVNKKYQRGYEKAKDQDVYFRSHETQIILFGGAENMLKRYGIKTTSLDVEKMQAEYDAMAARKTQLKKTY